MITVLEGDCVEVMATLEPDSVDAFVTDPPYGIGFMGREWDTFSPKSANDRLVNSTERRARDRDLRYPDDHPNPNLRGREKMTAVSASMIEYDMTRKGLWRFQRWCRVWASECLRVLKPGGYLVAFCAPRSYHRLACGVEDAGFEVRDMSEWIFGTGFPKSVDAEREVARALCPEVGRHFLRRLPPKAEEHKPGDHVCQATDISRQFHGIGSALKPSHEPILIARKPIPGTIGDNLVAFGTGGLYIEAVRLGSDEDYRRNCSGDRGHGDNRTRAGEAFHLTAGSAAEAGRWPPNAILTHLPECIPIGTARIKNPGGSVSGDEPSNRNAARVLGGSSERVPFDAYGDGDGFEEVERFLCAEGCPVAAVDLQASAEGSEERADYVATGEAVTTGLASRFFPSFRYEPKPSREERDLGCESLAPSSGATATKSKEGAARLNSPRTGAGRGGGARNIHPTVKPIALMRWLVRLVARPGQTILDPFLGSGTTGMAAKLEDVHCIGIEREPDYARIARLRIDAVERPPLLVASEVETRSGEQLGQADLLHEARDIEPFQ